MAAVDTPTDDAELDTSRKRKRGDEITTVTTAPSVLMLRCAICLDSWQDPVVSSCGHCFCRSCYTDILSSICPHCKLPFLHAPVECYDLRSIVAACFPQEAVVQRIETRVPVKMVPVAVELGKGLLEVRKRLVVTSTKKVLAECRRLMKQGCCGLKDRPYIYPGNNDSRDYDPHKSRQSYFACLVDVRDEVLKALRNEGLSITINRDRWGRDHQIVITWFTGCYLSELHLVHPF